VTAEEYLREVSRAMEDRYQGDCVTYACRVAELLVAEGRNAWIGRLRVTVSEGGRVFHAPLIPRRYAGRGAPAWTTHYVCGSEGRVYDPLAGHALDVTVFGETVFGIPIEVVTLFDSADTARLLARSALRPAVQRAAIPLRQ
jgi:hypothetical protein